MVTTKIETDEDVVTISKEHFAEYCKLKIQVERLIRLVKREMDKEPVRKDIATIWARDIVDILDSWILTNAMNGGE